MNGIRRNQFKSPSPQGRFCKTLPIRKASFKKGRIRTSRSPLYRPRVTSHRMGAVSVKGIGIMAGISATILMIPVGVSVNPFNLPTLPTWLVKETYGFGQFFWDRVQAKPLDAIIPLLTIITVIWGSIWGIKYGLKGGRKLVQKMTKRMPFRMRLTFYGMKQYFFQKLTEIQKFIKIFSLISLTLGLLSQPLFALHFWKYGTPFWARGYLMGGFMMTFGLSLMFLNRYFTHLQKSRLD